MRICLVYDCLFPLHRRRRRALVSQPRRAAGGRWTRGHLPDPAPVGARRARIELDARVRVVTAGPRMALYTPDGRRRILPPLVFGLGVLRAPAPPRPPLRRRAHLRLPILLAARRSLVRPLMGFELVVDWFEVWSRAYWREYLGGVGRARWRARAAPVRAGSAARLLLLRAPCARACASEGLRGPVTVLRGLYAGATQPAHAAGRRSRVVLFAGG